MIRPVDRNALWMAIADELKEYKGTEVYTRIRMCFISAPDLPPMEPIKEATWEYYMNDEGRARWRCSECGKVCRRNPHDKKRCSSCGAHMRMMA